MIVPLGAALGTSAVPMRVGFAATDASGICSYALQQSDGGDPFQPVQLATPTTTFGTPQITPSAVTHQFQVSATDCAKNQSPFTKGPSSTLTALPEHQLGDQVRGHVDHQ